LREIIKYKAVAFILTMLILLPMLGLFVLLAGCEYVEPKRGEPGSIVNVYSKPEARFGTETGTVLIGNMPAVVNNWSATTIEAVVPNLPEGKYAVKVLTTAGHAYTITKSFLVETSPAAEECWSNMKMVKSASNVYAAAHDGEYPGSLQQLIDEGFLEGPPNAYECPESGEIEWNFNPGYSGSPPDPICSIHGSTPLASTCTANMQTVISASHMYAAAHDGEYPGSLQQLIDGGFIEGPAYRCDCPQGGVIDWNWNPGLDGGPPEPVCSIHGSV
jgi:competence protein ComGC